MNSGEDRKIRELFKGQAWLLDFDRHADLRGELLPFDFDRIPFIPRRIFAVSKVPPGIVRGGHGHQSCSQILVCLNGSVEILMRKHETEVCFSLDASSPALVLGPGIWCQQKYADDNTVLLVLASEPYDPESYFDHWA